jgi:hypothetical protein
MWILLGSWGKVESQKGRKIRVALAISGKLERIF